MRLILPKLQAPRIADKRMRSACANISWCSAEYRTSLLNDLTIYQSETINNKENKESRGELELPVHLSIIVTYPDRATSLYPAMPTSWSSRVPYMKTVVRMQKSTHILIPQRLTSASHERLISAPLNWDTSDRLPLHMNNPVKHLRFLAAFNSALLQIPDRWSLVDRNRLRLS